MTKALCTSVFLSSLLLAAAQVHSTEAFKTVASLKVSANGANRNSAGAGNTVMLEFDASPAFTGGSLSGCSETKAYLLKADTHLLAALLTAHSLGKSIEILVDDTETKISGACQITNVGYF